ncbi:UBC-like protein [Metschnikowia bicuspidata var. bicuspidata NRRL YB-4993]|uniref:UBC-like protein n=1 Tax=Metschnikowia bicuspidata var. bicuspidata NRRL YB-4993 TaxID=869754 RepID=A0A1A0HFB1_9ASCO|nr:UBC-like protein [Metschnikowia bicuspidata var. bicuspidata NRRL YB-4993]OBA22582.1 UBC-like protein [Metschnikowia bicuspidata var. bicuspidata NRRL YB-4993]
MSHRFARRLLKEHQAFENAGLPGIEMLPGSDITEYEVIMCVDNQLYAGEKFLLLIHIGNEYPVEPPLVKFLSKGDHAVPLHPHIYSNGHICLNVLGKDWTPACNVESVVLSVQSMLSTNELAERPPDDDRYVRLAPKDPKNGRFVYHDDTV